MIDPVAIIEGSQRAKQTEDQITIVRRRSTVNLRWANNQTTTNGATDYWSLRVIAIDRGRASSSAATLTGREDPLVLLKDAEAGCEGRPEAPDAMPLIEGSGAFTSDDSQPIGAEALNASGVAEVCQMARREGNQTYGYVEHERIAVWLATSAGVRAHHEVERGRSDVTVKPDDLSTSTWQSSFTGPDYDPIGDYEQAAKRVGWAARSNHSLDPGRYEVILSPACVADMLYYMYAVSPLRVALDGRNAFAKPGGGTRIGERLSPLPVTISTDPDTPGLETTPFVAAGVSDAFRSVFDSGHRIPARAWVRDGVLEALPAPRWVAAKAGVEPFFAAGNLLVSGEGPSVDEMIASTERGLFVNAFWYIRMVDPQTMLLTGLTRDGVYLIEDGQIKGEVNNFRFNMSPLAMLEQVVEIGTSSVVLPREFEAALASAPPMRVKDWNFSSVSDAR
ncbi:MAG: metallopeptidase TldD-related protein [Actinomycetota bacterium]